MKRIAVAYTRNGKELEVWDNFLPFNTQIKLINKYSIQNNIVIKHFFHDHSSGGTLEREGLKNLFDFLSKNSEINFVLVANMNRLASDVYTYLSIEKKLINFTVGTVDVLDVQQDIEQYLDKAKTQFKMIVSEYENNILMHINKILRGE